MTQSAVLFLMACMTVLSLSACSTMPDAKAQREQTQLDLTITAKPYANPDRYGRQSPLMVRIYELKSDDAFQELDFFSLQNNDKTVLGEDLLNKEERILRPGETYQLRHKTMPGTTAIGIMAGYRNIAHAIWKKVYTLPAAPYEAWYRAVIPANKSVLNIAFDTNEIRIIPAESVHKVTQPPKKNNRKEDSRFDEQIKNN